MSSCLDLPFGVVCICGYEFDCLSLPRSGLTCSNRAHFGSDSCGVVLLEALLVKSSVFPLCSGHADDLHIKPTFLLQRKLNQIVRVEDERESFGFIWHRQVRIKIADRASLSSHHPC